LEGRDGSGRKAAVPTGDDPLLILAHEAQHAPLPSDRIRAASELARARRAQEEQQTDEVQLWIARKSTLLTLPMRERLTWLIGELQEEEEGGDPDQGVEEEGDGNDIVPPGRGGPPRAARDGTPGYHRYPSLPETSLRGQT